MSGMILGCAIAVLLLVSVAWGLIRGLTKSRIRFFCILLCAVIALVLTVSMKTELNTQYEANREAIQQALDSEQMQDVWEFIDGSESLREVVSACAGALVAPFVFLTLFIVLQFLTWILFFLVTLILHRPIKKADSKRRLRFIRTLIYVAAQFVIVIAVFLTPIVCCLDVAPDVLDAAKKADLIPADVQQQIDEFDVKKFSQDAVFATYRKVGGETLCRELTKFTVKGTDGEPDVETGLSQEIRSLSGFACNIVTLTKAGGIENFGEREAESIRAVGDSFGESALLPTLAGEVIYSAADEWLKPDGAFFGVKKPSVGDVMDPAFDALLRDFRTDARHHNALCTDFSTLANLVAILARDGVFANFSDTEQLVQNLGNGTTVKDMIEELGKNDTLKNLIPEITNIGMRAIASALSLPANAEEIYDEFIDDIVSAVNDIKAMGLPSEEQISELAGQLETALADSGVDFALDESVLSLYASALMEDFGSLETITETDVKEFFQIYAQINETPDGSEPEPEPAPVAFFLPLAEEEGFQSPAYRGKTIEELKDQSGAGLLAKVTDEIAKESVGAAAGTDFTNKVQEIIDKHVETYAEATGKTEQVEAIKSKFSAANITPDSITEKITQGTAALKSAEEMPTVKITVEDLLINAESAAKNISAETIQKEAEAVQNIFGSATSLLNSLPTSGKTDISDVANMAETLGTVLDELNNMNSFGEEKTTNLVKAVFQSDAVLEGLNMDLKSATELAERATEKSEDGSAVSYTDTMKGMGKGAEIANRIGSSNDPIQEEDIRELLENMTPQTAGMMQSYMTDSRLAGFGVPEAKAEFSALLIRNLFAEMAKQDKYKDQYDQETGGVLKMFDIASAATKSGSADSIFNHGTTVGLLGMTADDVVATIMSSNMVCEAITATMYRDGVIAEDRCNPFGLNIPDTGADYAECKQAIRNYYDAHESEQGTIVIRLDAIAALFGLPALELD